VTEELRRKSDLRASSKSAESNLREVELKLVSELMKNSRRSDRQLAKAVGVSQPTIGRMIKKLEKEGIIKEYTIIPDFRKLGYHIASLMFANLNCGFGEAEIEKAKEVTKRDMQICCPSEVVMFERGIGLSSGAVIVSLHRDYSSYSLLRNKTKEYPFLDRSRTGAFIIDLDDEIHYRFLTFSTLANHVLTMKQMDNVGHLMECSPFQMTLARTSCPLELR
jgi:DNA-binding Lrp family transcriptional regulator